ncbi:MAG TPA: hypothetical protein VFS21_35375 [Roseiflexaceae bacterium]|nr:hypothetical protein [Roseiflexaceae bacterium]
MSWALRAALLGYAALLRLYPRPFRRAFGGEMLEVFAATLSDAAAQGTSALLWLYARELYELPGNLLREYRALWFARPPRLHPRFPVGGGPFMDEPVPALSSLSLRPVYVGLVGGVAAAAALFLALCGALPLLGVPGWPAAPPALAGLGGLMTLLFPLVAGYCAARWDWSRDARGSLCAGALAGALAGLVAWLLVGSAGAGALGQAELLRYGARQAPTDTMLALLSESVAGIVWATHLSFWGLAGLGAALGGLGGWLPARAGSPSWGAPPRPVERAVLRALAGTALVVALFTLVCGLTFWGNLAARAGEAAQQSGRATSLPVVGVILLPCAALLAALVVALRALADRRAPLARGSLRARLLHAWRVAVPLLAAAMLTAVLTAIGAIALLLAAGGSVMTLMVSGGLLLIADARLFFGLTALVCAALSLTLRPTAAQQLTSIASRLRSGADYLLLAWPVCAALVKLGVTAAASSLVSGPIALIGVLTNGNDPLNPTAPGIVQTLIGTQLASTLLLALIPLLLLFCSSVYGALYRRWSAPHDLGWGLG